MDVWLRRGGATSKADQKQTGVCCSQVRQVQPPSHTLPLLPLDHLLLQQADLSYIAGQLSRPLQNSRARSSLLLPYLFT